MEFNLLKCDGGHILTINQNNYEKFASSFPYIREITTEDNYVILPFFGNNNNLTVTDTVLYMIWGRFDPMNIQRNTFDTTELVYKLHGDFTKYTNSGIIQDFIRLLWLYANGDQSEDTRDELQRRMFMDEYINMDLQDKFAWKCLLRLNVAFKDINPVSSYPSDLSDMEVNSKGDYMKIIDNSILYQSEGPPSKDVDMSFHRRGIVKMFPIIPIDVLGYTVLGMTNDFIWFSVGENEYKNVSIDIFNDISERQIYELLFGADEFVVNLWRTMSWKMTGQRAI